MNKNHFFKEIKDILLLEDESVNEETKIEIDSMASLLLIAFFDENFSKTISQEEIKEIKEVNDLIKIAGENSFE